MWGLPDGHARGKFLHKRKSRHRNACFSTFIALPIIRHLTQRIRAEISTNEPSVGPSLQIQLEKQPETFDGIQSRCGF